MREARDAALAWRDYIHQPMVVRRKAYDPGVMFQRRAPRHLPPLALIGAGVGLVFVDEGVTFK
jgi:hypothetical protein